MIYASELAVSALGLTQTGTPHVGEACLCCMCQRPINHGDISSVKSLPNTFMDFGNLLPGDYLCGFCATTSVQHVNRELQRSVITGQGIYNLNKDESRAWFWLTPPKPPYVVVINHSTMAAFHYHWRTPVTLDNEFVQLNVDDVLYQVRRSRVLKALEYADQLLKLAPSLPKSKSPMKSPFVRLLRNPSGAANGTNGHLARECLELAALYPACRDAVSYLQSLSPGELVAISPLLKSTPAPPVCPEFITQLQPKLIKEI